MLFVMLTFFLASLVGEIIATHGIVVEKLAIAESATTEASSMSAGTDVVNDLLADSGLETFSVQVPMKMMSSCSDGRNYMVDFSSQGIIQFNPSLVRDNLINQYGFIPPCFGLTLENNMLTMVLQPSFDSAVFRNMTLLNLANNQITLIESGTFQLGNIGNLILLYLGNNRLTELPLDFLDDTRISVLDLSYNQFQTLPLGVVNVTRSVTKLSVLSLAYNGLGILDLDLLRNFFFGNLILENNKITTIVYSTPTSVFTFSTLQFLDLSSNRISTVPPIFGCLSRLLLNNNVYISQLMDLRCTEILPAPVPSPTAPATSSTCQASTRLPTVLGLSGCSIAALASNSFPAVSSAYFSYRVQNLDLGQNVITYIEDGAFACIGELKFLFLSGNSLTGINSAMFENLLLQQFDVSFNELSVIDNTSLPVLTQLSTLSLQGNRITLIAPNTFQREPLQANLFLTNINLAKNLLVEILPSTFAGCSQVITLNLASNCLTQITEPYFSDMPLFETLDLSENNISVINGDTFKNESRILISDLDLSGNRLTMVSQSLMASLSGVETLNLADNLITFIETHAFNKLYSIVTLDLQLNEIALIRSDVCDS